MNTLVGRRRTRRNTVWMVIARKFSVFNENENWENRKKWKNIIINGIWVMPNGRMPKWQCSGVAVVKRDLMAAIYCIPKASKKQHFCNRRCVLDVVISDRADGHHHRHHSLSSIAGYCSWLASYHRPVSWYFLLPILFCECNWNNVIIPFDN